MYTVRGDISLVYVLEQKSTIKMLEVYLDEGPHINEFSLLSKTVQQYEGRSRSKVS